MSALTHSPGFFDVVRNVARFIQPVATVASFIPGLAPIAAPLAGISAFVSENDPASLLTSLPGQSVTTTMPQVPVYEEEVSEEEGPPPRGYSSWEEYYADPERG